MAVVDRRLIDLEIKLATVPNDRLTERQRLTVARYTTLLVQGRKIPKILQAQVKKLPPEPPPSLAIQAIIDDVMGENGDGNKNDNRVRGRK